jgi:hypothetical protein
MSNITGFFAFLNLYWKLTWKWFLGLIAGMAILELGFILYYINGGYRSLFFRSGSNRIWPTEYIGALRSIRLDYMIPVIAAVLIILLVLIFYSSNNKVSSDLTRRIPVGHKRQLLYQIAHTFIMFVYAWLVQFLILIAGFLLYRSNAPEGLNINFQMYSIFVEPGLISECYPFLINRTLWLFLLGLIILVLLPAYVVHTIEQGKVFRSVIMLIFVWIAGWFLNKISLLTGKALILSVLVVLILIMICGLFIRDLFRKKEYVPEILRLDNHNETGDTDQ